MDIKLTKDSDILICLLYKEYLQRRSDGISKSSAKYFGSGSREMHQNILPQWSFEDVDETCRELDRAGLLDCSYADNITWTAALSDAGIIYMENRFKDKIGTVVEHLTKVLGVVLPF